MISHRIDAVLFDLDGTLVDSAPDLIAAVDELVLEHGRQPKPTRVMRSVVSKGGRALLAKAFDDWSEQQREQLLPIFLERYAQNLSRHTRPFDDIEAFLMRLEQSGIPWGIVTNKPFYLAEPLIGALGWTSRCSVLLGGDSLAERKPHPLPLLHAAQKIGVDVARCVYVGDDLRDIQASVAANMSSIVALWGYREPHENPVDWGARAMADLPRDLHGLLP